MRDHTRLRAFKPADEVAVLVNRVTAVSYMIWILKCGGQRFRVVKTEKVLNGFIRALMDVDILQPSVFNLNTW